MINVFSNNLYKLNKFYREQLKEIIKDIKEKEISEEDYFRNRMLKFNVNIEPKCKDTRSKDDGIDFIIYNNNQIFICQLKFWEKALNKKIIKEIYGGMYLSDLAIKYRNQRKKVKFCLFCPFVNDNCIEFLKQYYKEDYYIFYNEEFIEALLNPMNFVKNRMFDMEESNYDRY